MRGQSDISAFSLVCVSSVLSAVMSGSWLHERSLRRDFFLPDGLAFLNKAPKLREQASQPVVINLKDGQFV